MPLKNKIVKWVKKVKEVFEILKKHKKTIILTALICFVVPLLIIHCLFKWYSGFEFLVAEWTAGELLGYVGTMLSFVGTVILGILALQASQKANKLSEKVIELEKDRYRLELRPFVLVSNWKAYEIENEQLVNDPNEKYIQIGEYKPGKALGLEIELTNTSESCITVEYGRGKTEKKEISWGKVAVNQENLKMTLAPGDKDTFIFYASPEFMTGLISHRVTIELYLENRFSKRYKETFVLIITSLSDKVSRIPGKWHCNLFAQEYTIGRFEKDKNGDTIYISEEL